MRYSLTAQQIEDEVKEATRLAEGVKRPKGVYSLVIEPDQDQDGNPMFLILIRVDDDPNPSDERLDELVDYEDRVIGKISDGNFASWPLVQLVPNESRKAHEP